MCWRCAEIDKEIDHYRCLFARVADEGSIKSLHILIDNFGVSSDVDTSASDKEGDA